MDYLLIKALHIIFVVTWFAGMFYIVRLFIYLAEANERIESEKKILVPQLKLMTKRLWYGITVPSGIITLIFGLWILISGNWLQGLSSHQWLHYKLFLVLLLYLYFFSLHYIYIKLMSDKSTFSNNFLRIWNEVATIFLVAIVILAVRKDSMSMWYGLLGLLAFVVILMSAIKIYKYFRTRNYKK